MEKIIGIEKHAGKVRKLFFPLGAWTLRGTNYLSRTGLLWNHTSYKTRPTLTTSTLGNNHSNIPILKPFSIWMKNFVSILSPTQIKTLTRSICFHRIWCEKRNAVGISPLRLYLIILEYLLCSLSFDLWSFSLNIYL